MPNKKGSKKTDQNTLMECMKCKKTYTLHMMIQIYSWLNKYKCIKCYNNRRTIYGKENDIYKLLS